MFRNWKLICQEKDPALRLLLATATDERILEGLEKGFSEFFAAEEQPLRVPHSAIREWGVRVGGNITFPNDVLKHFGIPHFTFHEGSDHPEGLTEMLGDKDIAINGDGGGGTWEEFYFDWNGKRCLVAEYAPNSVLILVPEGFIDMGA